MISPMTWELKKTKTTRLNLLYYCGLVSQAGSGKEFASDVGDTGGVGSISGFGKFLGGE